MASSKLKFDTVISGKELDDALRSCYERAEPARQEYRAWRARSWAAARAGRTTPRRR